MTTKHANRPAAVQTSASSQEEQQNDAHAEILRYMPYVDRDEKIPDFDEFADSKYAFVIKANLSSLKLSTVPIGLKNLIMLEYLDLSSNTMSSINFKFTDFINLSQIRLDSNTFEEFPDMLLEVKTLKVLSLANNFIKVIPPTINKLENLTYLNLRNNRLAELPDSLFDLNQLTCLILSKNRLKQMPEKLYQLNLYQLDLSFNMIEMIDDPKVLTTIPLLNLNFNPIHTPPQQVVRRGSMAIDTFLNDRKIFSNKGSRSKDDQKTMASTGDAASSAQAQLASTLSLENTSSRGIKSDKLVTAKFSSKFNLVSIISMGGIKNLGFDNLDLSLKNGAMLCDWLFLMIPKAINMSKVLMPVKINFIEQPLQYSQAIENAEYFLQCCRQVDRVLAKYCTIDDIINTRYFPILQLLEEIKVRSKKSFKK